MRYASIVNVSVTQINVLNNISIFQQQFLQNIAFILFVIKLVLVTVK